MNRIQCGTGFGIASLGCLDFKKRTVAHYARSRRAYLNATCCVFFVFLFLFVPLQGLVAIEEVAIGNGFLWSVFFVEEHGLDQFVHTIRHLLFIHDHLAVFQEREGGRMADSVLLVSIGVESDKDRVSVAHVFVEIHHALLLTDIVGMTELINLNDDDMRPEVNEDVGAVTGTTPIYGLVAAHRERVLEVRTERIHHIVFFEAEATGDGIVRVEDTVTAETVGFPAGFARQIHILTITTSILWCTYGTLEFTFTVKASLTTLT